jgi:hypothetical protein
MYFLLMLLPFSSFSDDSGILNHVIFEVQIPPLSHCLKRFSVRAMLVALVVWFSLKHVLK